MESRTWSGLRGVCAVGLACALGVASAVPAGAQGHGGMAHGTVAAPAGQMIRTAKVDGYTLMYHLLSWEERNAMMKGMEGQSMAGMDSTGQATNHLMLYLTGPDGTQVSGAKVGFMLTAPDKAEYKTLTMGMSGGYGADVNLSAKGVHRILTKAAIGGRTVTETFDYEVK